MSKISETHRTPLRRRGFPDLSYSPEELGRIDEEMQALMKLLFSRFGVQH